MNRGVLLVPLSLAALLSASSVGCATATAPSKLRRIDAPRGVVTRLADLRLEPGTECVATLADGSVVRGRLESISAAAIGLNTGGRSPTTGPRVLPETALVTVGRVVGMSKPSRAWLGAGIGVLVSLPLSISRVGDASVIGALLGTLVGRNIGDAHIEVLFERRRESGLMSPTAPQER